MNRDQILSLHPPRRYRNFQLNWRIVHVGQARSLDEIHKRQYFPINKYLMSTECGPWTG